MKFYAHQQRAVDENPRKALWNWEMRVGKSLPASVWVNNPCRNRNAYIIVKKQNKKDWLNMAGVARVLTKEEFKKENIVDPSAIVFDEAHNAGAALFVRRGVGRSQIAEKFYRLCQRYPEMDVLLLTATPIRNDAWSLHTLLCYIGVYYDWKAWREEFFEQRTAHYLKRQPWMAADMMPTAWYPRDDWRKNIRKYLDKHADIVPLSAVVEYLPPLLPVVVKVKTPRYKHPTDKVVTWVDEHLHEQTEKVKEVLALGYDKIIVVAHYTAQIDMLALALREDRAVFVLDGRTKDAAATIAAAQAAPECYLICQSGMGFGWDGWMFGAMVFASMGHSVVNHTQMLGRLRHPQHLKSTSVYYLIGGRWDGKIYETVSEGEDFSPFKHAPQPTETE